MHLKNSSCYLHSYRNKKIKRLWCSFRLATALNFIQICLTTSILVWWTFMVNKNSKKDQQPSTNLEFWKKVFCFVLMWLLEVWTFLKLTGLSNSIHLLISKSTFTELVELVEDSKVVAKLCFFCCLKKRDTWNI